MLGVGGGGVVRAGAPPAILGFADPFAFRPRTAGGGFDVLSFDNRHLS